MMFRGADYAQADGFRSVLFGLGLVFLLGVAAGGWAHARLTSEACEEVCRPYAVAQPVPCSCEAP